MSVPQRRIKERPGRREGAADQSLFEKVVIRIEKIAQGRALTRPQVSGGKVFAVEAELLNWLFVSIELHSDQRLVAFGSQHGLSAHLSFARIMKGDSRSADDDAALDGFARFRPADGVEMFGDDLFGRQLLSGERG